MRDDPVYRFVKNAPIPDKLIRSLGRAPLVRFPRKNYAVRMTLSHHYTLYLISFGLSDKRIAYLRGFTQEKVKWQVKQLLRIYDVRNRTELVATAIRRGDI